MESFSLIRQDEKDWKDTLNKLIRNKRRRKIDEKRNPHIIEPALFVEATCLHNACHATDVVARLVWSQPYLHHSPRPILRQDVPGCLLFRENTNRESETAKADTPRAASSKEKQKAILWDIHGGTGGLAT